MDKDTHRFLTIFLDDMSQTVRTASFSNFREEFVQCLERARVGLEKATPKVPTAKPKK